MQSNNVLRRKFGDDFFIFILLSRESDGRAVDGTNPDSIRRYLCFQVFRLNFASSFFNLLHVRSQAWIIIAKHLMQGHNNEAWVGVEPLTLSSWPS